MNTMITKGIRGSIYIAYIASALSLATLLGACKSDLLAAPPASISVSLAAAPVATPVFNGATIAWKTNVKATSSLVYGTSPAAYTYATPQSTTEATDQSGSITGLSSSTIYYYQVVSYLGDGRAFKSAEYSFVTTAYTPVTFSTPASSPTYDSATVAFNTDLATTVSLEYGTASGSYSLSLPRDSVPATSHNLALSGLLASTTYFCQIIAYTDSTHTALSAEFQFTTLANPNVLAFSIAPAATPSLTSLSISWTSNFACTHFVEYGTTNGGPYTSSTVATSVPAAPATELLSGLASGTPYYFKIHLLWDTGADFTSIQYTATTTPETAPTAAQKARGIWLIGGLSGATVSTAVSAIDLFDPVATAGYPQGRWFASAASTTGYTPASFAACAAYNGKIYVIGGFSSTGTTLNTVQIYDIAGDAWTAGATMPTPRANIYATALNGKIYILSGSQANATDLWVGPPAPAGVCYEYTPGAPGSWAIKTGYTATNNTDRFSYVYGSTLYSLGGRSAAAAVAAIVHDGYIPSLSNVTGTTELAMATAPSVARTGISGVLCESASYDPALVVIGGISGITNTTGGFINFPTTATGTMSNLVLYLAYPFAAPAAWNQASNNFPGTGIAFGTAVFSSATGSNRIYYFGGTTVLGTTAGGSLSARWIDAPQPPATWASSWTSLADMPVTGRWGQGAVTLNQ